MTDRNPTLEKIHCNEDWLFQAINHIDAVSTGDDIRDILLELYERVRDLENLD